MVRSELVTAPSLCCTARRKEMKAKHTSTPRTPRTEEIRGRERESGRKRRGLKVLGIEHRSENLRQKKGGVKKSRYVLRHIHYEDTTRMFTLVHLCIGRWALVLQGSQPV